MSSAVSYTGNKAKEIASEDFNKASKMAKSAVASGSYWYPIKGIFYLASHRSLWKPISSRLLPTMTLSVAVVAAMFAIVYVPQAIVLSFVNGPIAALSSILLTLSESSTIITFLSRNFLIKEALVDTFDATLLTKNQEPLVSEGRQVMPGSDPIKKLGKMIKRPFDSFTPTAFIRYLMYMPLNFIPVVGTALFILLQGRNRGYSIHNRYFQLKGYSDAQKRETVKQREGAYMAFGIVTTLLELVPLASIFFSFTNTVGAALWAADLERDSRARIAASEEEEGETSSSPESNKEL